MKYFVSSLISVVLIIVTFQFVRSCSLIVFEHSLILRRWLHTCKEGSLDLKAVSSLSDQTRCNVWILDGDLYHKGLLKFAVSAESLQETVAVFVADMSRPWTIMESLQKWASVLRDHIDKLKIPPEEMRDMEQKCE